MVAGRHCTSTPANKTCKVLWKDVLQLFIYLVVYLLKHFWLLKQQATHSHTYLLHSSCCCRFRQLCCSISVTEALDDCQAP